jgi:O-antigen/teichoic acid export membrane protein
VVASTVIMSFLVVGDKLLLGFFVSKTELAKYSIAALVASTTLFLVNNFASAWGSFLFKKLPNLNGVDFKIYYFTTMRKLVICIPIMLVAYSFQYFLYMFFFEQKYPKLSVEIFILTASYSLLGVSKFFMGFLNYFGRNELILYTALFSTVFMVLFSVFIFELSALSMAVSVFVSMFVLCIVISCLTTREVNKYAVK